MGKLIGKIILLAVALVAIGVIWQHTQLEALALARIDPVPETRRLIAEGRYAEAADYLGFFIEYPYVRDNPEAQALKQEIDQTRNSPQYQLEQVWEGLITGTSDETAGQITGVVTDFLVIGDLRDLTKEGIKLAKGEDADEVILALAAIGTVATTAQVVSGIATLTSGGAAAPAVAASTAVKGGTVLLKAARKAGKLPPWLSKTLIKEAKVVKQTGKLDSVADLFQDIYVLAKTPGGLRLLSHTEDAKSLKRMAEFAKAFGAHSATLYRIGGEGALKLAARANELGQDTIRLAATYGRDGLRFLDRLGALKFAKYTARAGRVAYKGDWVRLLAHLLVQLPRGLLYLIAAVGIGVWVPWRRLQAYVQDLSSNPMLSRLRHGKDPNSELLRVATPSSTAKQQD